MKRIIVGFSLFCALSGLLKAQAPTVQRAEDEFPGIQVLPPGSVVTGLSLPRYENHKVTAFMKADELKVISRNKINVSNKTRASLFIKALLIRLYLHFPACGASDPKGFGRGRRSSDEDFQNG